jgi:Cys-rich protein (TIGR01571 family)
MQLRTIFTVLALSPVADAHGFMSPQHASLLSKDMPVTKHDKTAGDDYNKGSPLYAKQETLAAKKKGAKKEGAADSKAEPAADGMDWLRNLESKVEPKVDTPKGVPKELNPLSGKDHFTQGIHFFFHYLIVTMLVALVWIKCIGRDQPFPMRTPTLSTGFAFGLFSLEHLDHSFKICFCSLCCSPLRIADTYSKEPNPIVKSFWVALLMVTCLFALLPLTYQATWAIFLCIAVGFRQKLRNNFKLESGGKTWLFDCASWIFCPCCAIVQEARQVELVQSDKMVK